MSNWDDQFDFDDAEDNSKKNKNKNANKKNKKQDQDFFDLQDNSKKQGKSSLPSINQRQSAKIQPQVQVNKSKNINPYAQKFFGKNQKKQQQDFQEQMYEEVQEQPKIVPKGKQNKNKKNNDYQEEYYFEEELEPVQSVKPEKKQAKLQIKKQPENDKSKNTKKDQPAKIKKDQPAKIKKDQPAKIKKDQPAKIKNLSNISNTKSQVKKYQEQYEQEFQDGYGDDFQELDKSPQKTQPTKDVIKPKTNNLTPSVQKNPPKPPQKATRGNINSVVSNKNINKVGSQSISKKLMRNSSKNSIKSNQSRKLEASRVSRNKSIRKNQSEYIPNKHFDIVQKSFPQSQNQMRTYNPDKIIKTNQRMRAMIRKFNQELNDLINKNMMLLKSKTNQKHTTVQDKVKQLQIQRKTGQTAIQVMQKQFQKLYGRQGQLKEQEYQLILQKKISQLHVTIKQTTKQITLMKRDVQNKGNKLSAKQQHVREAQNIHHIKTVLIQAKKDEETREQKINRLDTNFEELTAKLSDIDYQMQELVTQAKQKGINLQNHDALIKKFEEYKKKLQTIKNYNSKSENLGKTKIDILNHQNDQIRITIRNIHSQISNLIGSIDHAHNQTVKIIEKAKQSPSINQLFSENLDKLLRQIEQAKINNDYQVRSQTRKSGRSQSKNKPLKNSLADNIQKSIPLRSGTSQHKVHQSSSPKNDQVNMVKPKFTKKKTGSGLQIQNKNDERVWNEQEQALQRIQKKQTPKSIQILQQPVEQKKDKIKPFSIKKNKDKTEIAQQNKQKQPVKQIVKVQQQKNQQALTINIAPRMMKFGKKKQDSKNDISSNSNDPKQQQILAKQVKKNQQAKQEEQKPIFAPKRFNLRNKVQKKQDSYAPSIQEKQVPVVQEYKPKLDFKSQSLDKPKVQTSKQQEYKPKFNFKKQEQIKPIVTSEQKPEENDQIKPKLNLRLKDRLKKQQNDDDSYNPTIKIKQKQTVKNQISLDNKNPYAPKSNPYAPKQDGNLGLNINSKNTKQEQPISNPSNPYAPKQNIQNNPYAPKQQSVINPYAPKQQVVSNPYAPKQETNVNNPYAPSQGLKREKGPLKKQKPSINNSEKQKINIYEQAQDVIVQLKDQQNKNSPQKNNLNSLNNQANNNGKSQQLDLNAMLGIKKQNKKSDFDDLLGDVAVNKKQKRKKDDFFDNMDI